ncbi:MAG TPA: DUF1553 domain-containing protein [Pirellulaceae bacterium]|nr:DUF1553 domain-containing protein [Pirellulaceae bacterium]HMP70832.1 DUF1553 domain-containing protein [Pirellulaceae bacterium]
MKSIILFNCVVLILHLFAPWSLPQENIDPPDFQTEILPLLSDRCFTCHGPDSEANESGLRLDLRAAALAELESGDGYAIVPGDPSASQLLNRLRATDKRLVMPPPSANRKQLTSAEIDALSRWIEAGAEYARHWAFEPVARTIVPPTPQNTAWSKNAIDDFVLALLERHQLAPSDEAERWRWLRRVTYDLSGLPPTPDEMFDFLNDESEDAYEQVVNRLLSAETFGQHLAVSWLDLARYADSYGYQSDLLCQVWPYRDWVVRAFNENKPYDRFIIEQLAGDLIPTATMDQRVATAFNRLHRQTNEGGSIDEEWRTEYAADRVHTFGTAFLGLTLECARCHDHKFDPISTREYYQLMAFFNSIDEAGTYNDSVHIPTPTLLLFTPEACANLQEIDDQLRNNRLRLDQLQETSTETWKSWAIAAEIALPPPTAMLDFERRDELNQIPSVLPNLPPANSALENKLIPAINGNGLQFSGDHALDVDAFAFQIWQPFTICFNIKIPSALHNGIVFHQSIGTDTGFSGTQLELIDGRLRLSMVRFWPGNAISVETKNQLPSDTWLSVSASYDGSAEAGGLKIYVNEELDVTVIKNDLSKSPAARKGLSFGSRFRTPGISDAVIDDLFLFDQCLTNLELRMLHTHGWHDHPIRLADQELPVNAEFLKEHYIARFEPASTELALERRQLIEQKFAIANATQELMVMEEMAEPRETHVLFRGEYDSPKHPDQRVTRQTPEILGTLNSAVTADRRHLAEWLVTPDHPLTSRVAVNRFWQHFFGVGLVETSDDFGLQGDRPLHGQLLDWLARDFIEGGWNVKRLCKQITLSATYRQDSRVSLAQRQGDPGNRFLARGPARKLSAEALRDMALFTAGLLDARLDGPPASPYQPPGLWREYNSFSPEYSESQGSDLFRRSLYSVWKRTAPLPNMLILDAAGRETCAVRRTITSTPLQALVLMNDPQFVEAARFLALRTLADQATDTPGRIQSMFERVTSRPPSHQEITTLTHLLNEQRQLYTADPDAASQFMAVGSLQRVLPSGQTIDVAVEDAELAAWSILALTIFNSDAAIMVR